MSFLTATAVRPGPAGCYDAEIAPGWDIGGNANGGYLLALAGRAMAAAADRPDPVTVTTHYLRPGRPGPVVIDTHVVKSGSRFTTVEARMVDASERPVLAALGTFGDLDPALDVSGPTRLDAGPPDLPPVEECQQLRRTSLTDVPPFQSKVCTVVHPDDAGFAAGYKSGHLRVRGWFRLGDDIPIDTVALLVAVDAFPPTLFNADFPRNWVPTLELTVHVRCRPQSDWLRCAFSTRFAFSGVFETDGELWDGAGTLVAQSRQLGLIPRADEENR